MESEYSYPESQSQLEFFFDKGLKLFIVVQESRWSGPCDKVERYVFLLCSQSQSVWNVLQRWICQHDLCWLLLESLYILSTISRDKFHIFIIYSSTVLPLFVLKLHLSSFKECPLPLGLGSDDSIRICSLQFHPILEALMISAEPLLSRQRKLIWVQKAVSKAPTSRSQIGFEPGGRGPHC